MKGFFAPRGWISKKKICPAAVEHAEDARVSSKMGGVLRRLICSRVKGSAMIARFFDPNVGTRESGAVRPGSDLEFTTS